ncbi:6-pyruvoyltetrahydropterin synthase [Alicyclobacillus acidoterrestris]|nr:6-pyruvoyltetrahydropterin synthase [Alicyclobacillus acidoterrestris]
MMYMSRKVTFSAAHFYRIDTWSEEENQRVFGLCSNPNGHGHDYTLEVMVRGYIDEKTGIVVNIVDVDKVVKDFLHAEIDGKFLNHEHPYFHGHLPTTENIVHFIWDSLQDKFSGCELHQLRLHENDFLYSEKEFGPMVQLTRKYHFSAAHRLHSDQLTDEENVALFGKCNNPHGHGHNYKLEVTVRGSIHPVTGMVTDLAELDETVSRVVLQQFDHKHLNLDTTQFQTLNPTSEVVATVIWDMLRDHVPNLYKVGLWETEKNYFEYYGDGQGVSK